jgi:DNA-directed RNA polymerase specialized sigma24 family protein
MTDTRPSPDGKNTVNRSLTPRRRRRRVENDEYAGFLRRAIAAYGRRVAEGDIDALASFNALVSEATEQLGEAVFFLRVRGYSWADIGQRLGVTRQAAQQRWGSQS